MTTQQTTLDSREVSKMIDREHDQLLRTIRSYISILDSLNNQEDIENAELKAILEVSAQMQTSDFFIESSYIDSSGRPQPCYLCTKWGCDLIAHKMKGAKGVLFTANYIKRFDEMTKQLQEFTPYAATRQTIGEVANLLRETRLIAKDGKISLAKAIESITLYLQAKGEPFSNDIAKLLLEKTSTKELQSTQLMFFGSANSNEGA